MRVAGILIAVMIVVGAIAAVAWRNGEPRRQEKLLQGYERRADEISQAVIDRRKAAGCDDETYDNANAVLQLNQSTQNEVGIAQSRQRLGELRSKREDTDLTNAERSELVELNSRIGKLRADGYGKNLPSARP